MTSQGNAVFTKEFAAGSGILIIENIFSGTKSKADVIKEILETTGYRCPDNNNLVQSACRNTADCGSHEKEAEI